MVSLPTPPEDCRCSKTTMWAGPPPNEGDTENSNNENEDENDQAGPSSLRPLPPPPPPPALSHRRHVSSTARQSRDIPNTSHHPSRPASMGASFDTSHHRSTIYSIEGDQSPYIDAEAEEEEGEGGTVARLSSLDAASSPSATTPSLPPPRPRSPRPPQTRSADFWMYDGSIVLCVENTLFRVHQTILANHSEVFADLFTVPQPEGEQMVEGCHVVRLHDDLKDFEELLKAIYVPDYFEQCKPDSELDAILSFTSGILRLSTKYVIRYLRARCIALLTSKLPTTFEGYESKSTSPHADRYRSDTIMRALALAKAANVPTLLPYAYYCLSRFPHKRFLKDRAGDISWRDKTVVLIGRERLWWAQMSMSHAFLLLFQRAQQCASPLCAHARSPHAEWHELEKHGGAAHPLRAYDAWANLNVCAQCVAYCKYRHMQGRREVWSLLPSWFELPPWEELQAAQNR